MSNQDEKIDRVEDHIKKRFTLQKKVGQGAYGVVFKAIDKKNKRASCFKKTFRCFSR